MLKIVNILKSELDKNSCESTIKQQISLLLNFSREINSFTFTS